MACFVLVCREETTHSLTQHLLKLKKNYKYKKNSES